MITIDVNRPCALDLNHNGSSNQLGMSWSPSLGYLMTTAKESSFDQLITSHFPKKMHIHLSFHNISVVVECFRNFTFGDWLWFCKLFEQNLLQFECLFFPRQFVVTNGILAIHFAEPCFDIAEGLVT